MSVMLSCEGGSTRQSGTSAETPARSNAMRSSLSLFIADLDTSGILELVPVAMDLDLVRSCAGPCSLIEGVPSLLRSFGQDTVCQRPEKGLVVVAEV